MPSYAQSMIRDGGRVSRVQTAELGMKCLGPLARLEDLTELALDGNPLSNDKQGAGLQYRSSVLELCPVGLRRKMFLCERALCTGWSVHVQSGSARVWALTCLSGGRQAC